VKSAASTASRIPKCTKVIYSGSGRGPRSPVVGAGTEPWAGPGEAAQGRKGDGGVRQALQAHPD
jgi:hypothetical protein